MLKIISPKLLSSAIALALFAGSASATTVYDTYKYLFDNNGLPMLSTESGVEPLDPFVGPWAAGYFKVNPLDCPNGCDLTKVSLLLAGDAYSSSEPSSFTGVTLEVFSNFSSPSGFVPGANLFSLTTPDTVLFNGNFGTRIEFTAPAQDPNDSALLQPNTEYWLKLTNVNQTPEFGWFYNGSQAGEYWAVAQWGNGEGSPFIFDVTGDARLSHVPIPGAVWMMGSGLIGLLVAGRRRN